MLVGAHVSPSGGLYKAVERGTDLGARAIQIFNQSPRAEIGASLDSLVQAAGRRDVGAH